MIWFSFPFLFSQITDENLVILIFSVMDSPYANYLIRQFVLAAITKVASRPTTSSAEQDRIAEMLAKYTSSPELELQQRAVEFASLFTLGDMRMGVLEQMPPPELKATVMGVGEFRSLSLNDSTNWPSHQLARRNLLVQQRAMR